MAISPLWAQTGTVRVRVTASDGSINRAATVSPMNSWDRVVGVRSTDRAGEILWRYLPLGDSYVYAQATGFYPVRTGVARFRT
jgi:hypothetical protein